MSIKKPTILVLASTFPRWKDDTEPRFVYDLCQHLKEAFEIIVLSPHCKGAKTYEVLDDLEVYRYRYGFSKIETIAYEGGIASKLKKNKLNWFMLPLFFIGQWFAILKLLRKYPVQVIHAHWLIPQGIIALAARIVCSNKPKLICTSHGSDLYSLNDPISQALKKIVIKKAELITVVSTPMQNEVKQLVPEAESPVVAPMGTNLGSLFIPDKAIQREKYQLLFVGRLVDSKGHKYLLEALPEIIKKYPEVTLNIVGTGPEKSVLELQIEKLGIKKQVSFLGRLSHEELVRQYRTSVLGVFPFIQEGLGLVTIEAMGCELPVVVSDIPAIHDIVTDGVTGVLVPPLDTKEIANKVIKLLASPEYASQLAQQGRKQVLNKFSWEVSAKEYSSQIHKISALYEADEEKMVPYK